MWVCDQTDLPLGVCCCYLQTEERCIHHINEPHKKSTWEKTERNTEIKASRHFLRASVSMTETVKNIIHHYNNHNIITNFSCSQCLPICSSQPNNHMFVLGSLILNYAYYTFFLNVSVWGHPIAGTLKYVTGKCLYSVSVIPIPQGQQQDTVQGSHTQDSWATIECPPQNLSGSSSFSWNVYKPVINVNRSEWECLAHGAVWHRLHCETSHNWQEIGWLEHFLII